MGGVFLKKVWREALFATPRPVLGHPPLPRRGGGGGRQRIAVQNIYTTITSSPGRWYSLAYFAKSLLNEI